MACSGSELERLIVEKNQKLNTLNKSLKPNCEEVHKIYDELDRMLFLYYKSLGGKKDLTTLKKIIR